MRIGRDHWLLNKPIAHRGLWGGRVIENSIPAYQAAVQKGFPIEIDIYESTDGVLFSFHDSDLFRMTGEKGLIYQKTSQQLRALNLLGTNEKIPTFDEVLETVNGKVPILIELKDQPNKSYIKKVIDRLKNYDGEFAIQAFNPTYINKVKKFAPQFIRGILGTESKAKDYNFIVRFVARTMCFNFLIKPDFISYSYSGLPLKKSKVKNKRVLAWTVTDQATAERIKPLCDNIIFEDYTPI